MNDEAIPADIQRFINLHIESVAKLEALLLIYRNPQQEWDASLLAKRLYISTAETTKILMDLANAQFTENTHLPSGCSRYQSTNPQLDALVSRLAELYSKRLVEVTNLIHQRAAPPANKSLQMFADAFKLKKDKET